jgi:transcriptional regulator with XRE-family HTH domain
MFGLPNTRRGNVQTRTPVGKQGIAIKKTGHVKVAPAQQGNPMASAFGQKIKTHRHLKRMTLDQLATHTGCSKSYIWELETRVSPPHPSAEKIFALAAALGVTPEFLLTDAQTEPDDSVVDEAFYRKYKRMPSETKRRLRQIVDAWDADS